MTDKREFILKKIAELEGNKNVDIAKLVNKKSSTPPNIQKKSVSTKQSNTTTVKKDKKIKINYDINQRKENKKILLIDSNKNFIKTLKLFLIKKGYKLFINEFGGFPFGLVKQYKPDLVILEHKEKSEKAKEFVKLLRIHPSFHKIPIIILTNSRNKQDVIDFFKLKVSGYILKPVEKDKLLIKIEEIFKK